MAGLHRHELDFEILETGNPKTLVFVDSSEYMEEPERPLLEVVLPGHTKYLLVNVQARKVNTFNSSTIGINEVLSEECLVELPDGVYELKYKICPYKHVFICKKHMRVTQLNQKIALLHSKIDLADCHIKDDVELQKELFRIYSLIEGAKAVVNYNSVKAQSYYQLADKLVQKQLDKICKNCN
jgi:hypothetical protein